ncbi:MAG TPA: hypothetical protein VGO48_02725 [Conexibacter sp.]|jgi:hypothetical protein|nr:hypothetical protein [Conexibacter sp.]
MRERFDHHRTALVTAVFVVVLLLGAATQFLPRLTQRGDVVSSTPVRADLASVQPIVLAPGARACLEQVTLDAAARIAQVTIASTAGGNAGTRLALETSGAGDRATATAIVAPGQAGPLDIPFTPPPHGAIGTVCVRNTGAHRVALAGTADPRALTRSTIVIDGARQGQAFSLTLREAGDRSLLNRVSQLVDRTAALSAVGPWLLWLLIPLLLLGVPAGVVAALRIALRDPDPVGADTGRPNRPRHD